MHDMLRHHEYAGMRCWHGVWLSRYVRVRDSLVALTTDFLTHGWGIAFV
jgi:hypothetical protein